MRESEKRIQLCFWVNDQFEHCTFPSSNSLWINPCSVRLRAEGKWITGMRVHAFFSYRPLIATIINYKTKTDVTMTASEQTLLSSVTIVSNHLNICKKIKIGRNGLQGLGMNKRKNPQNWNKSFQYVVVEWYSRQDFWLQCDNSHWSFPYKLIDWFDLIWSVEDNNNNKRGAVSYTHLTLPTMAVV